jgi:hypothetical protein
MASITLTITDAVVIYTNNDQQLILHGLTDSTGARGRRHLALVHLA